MVDQVYSPFKTADLPHFQSLLTRFKMGGLSLTHFETDKVYISFTFGGHKSVQPILKQVKSQMGL